MKQFLVGVDRLPTGELVCAAASRQVTTLWRGDGRAWTLLHQWKGKQVTAFCAAGDTLVCPALGGVVYLWSESGLRQVTLPNREMEIDACCFLEDGRVLMGGSPGLAFYDPGADSITAKRLGEFGVDKPGRRIHGVVRCGSRVFVVGARNLALEWVGDGLVEVANKATFNGQELLFTSAAAVGDTLWLSGHGLLARVEGGQGAFWQDPFGDRNSAIGMRPSEGELMAFQRSIVLGSPDNWRPLLPNFQSDPILAVEKSPIPGELCVVCYSGQSYALSNGAAHPTPLFV